MPYGDMTAAAVALRQINGYVKQAVSDFRGRLVLAVGCKTRPKPETTTI